MIELLFFIIWRLAGVTVLLFTLLASSITALYWWHSNLTFTKCYRNIPTIKMRPIFSFWEWFIRLCRQKNQRSFILHILYALCKLFSKEGIFVIWIGPRPAVIIFKPELVEVLLNNSRTIRKSYEYNFLKPWLGTGLLTSTGDKWHSRRKLLTPTFHFKILENFLLVFNEEAAVLTKKMESEVGKPWIDIVPMITLCTLDTICQTAMGVDLKLQSGHCKEYVDGINAVSEVFFNRLFRPWLWLDSIFYCFPVGWQFRKNVQHIHDFTRKVIKEKKEVMLMQKEGRKCEETLSGNSKKKAFLELLLEMHLKDSSFTEENIREEVDTFMFEGHDTTAMSISWTLYELGRHPEIQERIFQELIGIFGSDIERQVTSEDLKHMKYLECVIKESLRLYPSVLFFARQLQENLKMKDYMLTPGCTCVVCVLTLHQDTEQFAQPEIFDPDRFLPENNAKRHPYAYIPFSAGPRNCIGQKFALMEEKTVLAHILRKFKVTSLDPRDKIQILIGLTLKNADPIRINLALRETVEG